jgi:ankyrin repeat protein
LKKLKAQKDIDHKQEMNKVDEEKNTSMHMIMRHFNVDPDSASKVAVALIKRGSNLKATNVHKLTPLHVALYYGQNEAIQFAFQHNSQIRKSKQTEKYALFDFCEQSGKLLFSPLHYAVYQNNFPLLTMILKSEEIIDHELVDIEGRKAIDLCNSISSIFKTLRTELRKQKSKFVIENVKELPPAEKRNH